MSGEAVTLVTPIEALPGVTERQAGFMRSLGVTNLGRLVAYLPMRHERVEGETPVREMKADTLATARGEITATRPVRRGRSPRFEAVLHDGTGRLDLVWFNQMFVGDRVAPGVFLRGEGKVRVGGRGCRWPTRGGTWWMRPRPARRRRMACEAGVPGDGGFLVTADRAGDGQVRAAGARGDRRPSSRGLPA